MPLYVGAKYSGDLEKSAPNYQNAKHCYDALDPCLSETSFQSKIARPDSYAAGVYSNSKYLIRIRTHWTYLLQILSKLCFQRVAFSGNYEIVAISTDKTTIFNDLDYKADIGQHFHKSEKSARWRHRHKIIKTNLKTHISLLLTRPQGSHGCQNMRQDPLNMPVEVWRAKIAPKLKNIRKCLRKQGFFDIFSSILMVFLSLCLLGAILAQKENTFICEKKNVIF